MTIYNFQRKEWRCSITCGGGGGAIKNANEIRIRFDML